jgi:hypothetical protein
MIRQLGHGLVLRAAFDQALETLDPGIEAGDSFLVGELGDTCGQMLSIRAPMSARRLRRRLKLVDLLGHRGKPGLKTLEGRIVHFRHRPVPGIAAIARVISSRRRPS